MFNLLKKIRLVKHLFGFSAGNPCFFFGLLLLSMEKILDLQNALQYQVIEMAEMRVEMKQLREHVANLERRIRDDQERTRELNYWKRALEVTLVSETDSPERQFQKFTEAVKLVVQSYPQPDSSTTAPP